ncbi:hypothetical protein ACFLT2_01745 [Acidobacteriota bacterium]
MFRKFLLLIALSFLLVYSIFSLSTQDTTLSEIGVFDISFMGEKVGYEEYTWQSTETGYLLTVRGRMTKPIPMVIDKLTIRLDKAFIPNQYYFEGSVSGVRQEVLTVINEGQVESVILVAGQEQKTEVKIKRDAFLLPNPVYSPYMVLTKKFPCSLQEKAEFSAYIVPHFETPFTLDTSEENPCLLIMDMSGTEILIGMDDGGKLMSLEIPLKNLEIIRTSE